jgi:predicted dienelactone hydrolase
MSSPPQDPPSRRARARAALLLALVIGVLISACGQTDAPQTSADGPGDSHLSPTLLPRRARPTLAPLATPTTTTPPPSRVGEPDTADVSQANGEFAVGLTTLEFTDTTRPSAARGATPARNARSFVVTVRYPANGTPDTPEGALDPATSAGPFPLVVFAHDTNLSATRYEELLHGLSAAGYIVAAPDFPLTSSALDGPTDESDVVNQPGDVKFLISKLLTANDQPGTLQNLIAGGKIAVAGHADGGLTAAATAYNACCIDTRIKAVIALSTAEALFPDTWFTAKNGPPYLAVHGDKDDVVPIEAGQTLYGEAPRPRWFVTIAGGDHQAPYTDGPEAPAVARIMADFLDARLKADPAAEGRLSDDGNQSPFQVRSDE